jgi:hypothetical protein
MLCSTVRWINRSLKAGEPMSASDVSTTGEPMSASDASTTGDPMSASDANTTGEPMSASDVSHITRRCTFNRKGMERSIRGPDTISHCKLLYVVHISVFNKLLMLCDTNKTWIQMSRSLRRCDLVDGLQNTRTRVPIDWEDRHLTDVAAHELHVHPSHDWQTTDGSARAHTHTREPFEKFVDWRQCTAVVLLWPPLHNSGALPLVHELFKRPSYIYIYIYIYIYMLFIFWSTLFREDVGACLFPFNCSLFHIRQDSVWTVCPNSHLYMHRTT